MKLKLFIPIVLSIVIGFLLGKFFFTSYDNNSLTVFDEGEKVYFLQMGVYSTMEKLSKLVKEYDDFLIIEEKDGYHLYVGITKDEKIAQKVKEYYEEQGNNIYVKDKNVSNYSFLNILTEYDKITMITSSNKDLIGIEKIVISNYKEMVLESEFIN